jgi:hypothetical protein
VAAVKVKNLPLALTLQKNQEPFQYKIFQCLACYSSHEEGREPAGLTSHGRRVQVARPLKNQKKLADPSKEHLLLEPEAQALELRTCDRIRLRDFITGGPIRCRSVCPDATTALMVPFSHDRSQITLPTGLAHPPGLPLACPGIDLAETRFYLARDIGSATPGAAGLLFAGQHLECDSRKRLL